MRMGIKETDDQYVSHAYGRFNVVLTDGKGSTVHDENGKEYIDFGSGIGVTAFGIADEEWKNAVIEQLGRIQHTSNLYYTEPCAELAKLLCEKTGMKKVFFGNSGAEANEGMIKFARKYSYDKYGEGRKTIITLVNSFHGRTVTTLSATGQEGFHKIFGPFTPGFKYCPANDIEALNAMITDDVCAIMFECVQGEGGVLNLNADFVKEIARIAREKDILMCVDEVQTGNGRTGKYFSYMHYGIEPDIVSTAKGLAGGLPMGAVLFSSKLEDTVTPGSHGSTFGGNPIAAAGAISIVKRIDDTFLQEVSDKSKYIVSKLKEIKGVKSVSGMGLMLGIETDYKAADIANKCLEKGLLVLTAKTKIRLLPALNITKEETDKGLSILKEVIENEALA
ncbi:MAG TPA: aspartate aminotransferase family protein [Candidatus Eubacterium faecipullorum]|uniref:Acetylornithine aminotransferase n=1 Tax=Candidatus Eubacterium faecipullorum TaxID=2838571 RepID=A0A9D1UFP3_9FIRM|nr:aspartate aminotransferase family protein [Candidatus Eubacterium faecipullorum]